MIRFLGIALCAVLCALLLRDKNKTVALLLSVGAVCMVLFSVLSELRGVLRGVEEIAAALPSSAGYIRLMLRVLAITLLSGIVGNICRDNGETALAGATETAAKIVVLAMVLPLFETVITIVNGLIK